MLCRTILTLLIASNSISRIQVREIGERSAQLNKTRVDGVNTVIEASTIQKDNIFNIAPNDESIYGSMVKVKNNIYESPDSLQPTSTQTRTVVAPGGPGYDGVSSVKLEERHQGQPEIRLKATTYMSGNHFDIASGSKLMFGSYIEQNNNVNRSSSGNNQTQPNVKDISPNGDNIGLRADAILTNNHVTSIGGNMTINIGSSITYNGIPYTSSKNSQTGKKPINGTEKEDDEYDAIMQFFVRKQRELEEKQNAEIKPRLIGIKYGYTSYPKSKTEEKPNGQTSLSPNVFFLFTYFLIILIKLTVLI